MNLDTLEFVVESFSTWFQDMGLVAYADAYTYNEEKNMIRFKFALEKHIEEGIVGAIKDMKKIWNEDSERIDFDGPLIRKISVRKFKISKDTQSYLDHFYAEDINAKKITIRLYFDSEE